MTVSKRVIAEQELAAEVAEHIVAARDHIKLLWNVFYAVDCAQKLLDRSERLKECECEAECFRDIEGPKIILKDTLEKFEHLLAAIEEARIPPYLLDNIIVKSQEGGAE